MIVYLIVSSWAGVSPGAFHVYGYLRDDDLDSKVELTYAMTPAQAAHFNKDEPGRRRAYKAGNESSRFMSYDNLEQLAIKVYRTHFPGATILMRGKPSACGPKKVLDGPEPLKTEGNALWRRAEALHWYNLRSNWQEMDDISDEWDQLLRGAM